MIKKYLVSMDNLKYFKFYHLKKKLIKNVLKNGELQPKNSINRIIEGAVLFPVLEASPSSRLTHHSGFRTISCSLFL